MIRLIASDMDGTLLNSYGQLPNDFFSLHSELNQRDIMFAAASGRQYYTLLRMFEQAQDNMVFIAENGGIVMYRGEELMSVTQPAENWAEVIREARKISGAHIVLCGKRQAYVEDDDALFWTQVDKYYARSKRVEDLLEVTDDEFFKVAVYNQNKALVYSSPRLHKFNDQFKVVISGADWVDVSSKSANKGEALKCVAQRFGLTSDELAVFGDQMNDVDMMQVAGASYAMRNAPEAVKSVANHEAPSNDEAGVMVEIRKMLVG